MPNDYPLRNRHGLLPVPGVPDADFPRNGPAPTDPDRNRGLFGEVLDPAMEPDRGIGGGQMAQPSPRIGRSFVDEARSELVAPLEGPPDAAAFRDFSEDTAPQDRSTRAAMTRLQPSRTTPFSSRDAQALAGLDRRALDEARALAALDEPKAMTATFGGQTFGMTPAQRVDRNELAQIYNKFQGKLAEERQDKVRGEGFRHQQEIVSIPGRQGIEKRGMELASDERQGAAERAFKAPTRDSDIAARAAGTAAVTGAEARAQTEHGERINPEQQVIDEALAAAQASPFATTPAGRARIAALYKLSTVGKRVPAEAQEAAAGTGAPDAASVAITEVANDPAINALIERAKKTEPGVFTGGQGRATGAAARRVAASAITARLRQAGVPDAEIQDYITSALGAQAEPGSGTFGRIASAPLRMIPGGGMIADAISGR